MLPDKCKFAGCFEPGWCRDGRCGTHTTQARNHASYHYCPKPKTDDPHLGVELEFSCPTRAIYHHVRAMKRNVCFDGSVGGMGGEMKILGIPPKVFAPAMSAATQLTERGAKISRACGFHVHMDRRGTFNRRLIDFRLWAKTYLESWFFGLMPPSRRDNAYCSPITDGLGHSRYEWLSVTSKETVECRLHGGTLNPYKIQGWLAVCHDLMNLMRGTDPLPAVEFATDTKLPEPFAFRTIFPTPKAREYLTSRHRCSGVFCTSSRDEERDQQ